MTIVTVVKQVPEAEARVRVVDGALDLAGVTFVLDGMDEYGVEQALRLREAGTASEVVVLGYGPRETERALRTALAMGADRAVLVVGDAFDDPLTVALALVEAVREAAAEMVFVGGKHADWDSAALGPALAEALGWPHVDWTTALRVEDGRFEAEHEIDDGSETLRGSLPVVITTQQGLAEPRYPTLPNIMKANRKPLEERSVEPRPKRSSARSYAALERQRRRVVIEGDARSAADELVRRLREEAKVL